jgi:hypothetical protein
MSRCCVAYAPAGLLGGGPPVLVALGPGSEQDADGSGAPRPPRRPVRPPWWLLVVAGVLALGAWLLRPDPSPAVDLPELPSAVVPRSGPGRPVVVETAAVVAAPWRGVFEHQPDARGSVAVPRVHVLSLAGIDDPDRRALLVVDATRRAFAGPEGAREQHRVRVLGTEGEDGLRTLQWDDASYGMSLTAAGFSPGDHDRLRAALALPDGPSLVHGRAPSMDAALLAELGLELTHVHSRPGSAYGSPLIGQSGGASIEGHLHQLGSRPLLVSVVQDQVASAGRVRRAFGAHVAIDVGRVPGVVAAAVVAHPGEAPVERRVRGWTRLLLDHPLGVTIELSSDDLGADALVEAALALDLDRLARTAVPSR